MTVNHPRIEEIVQRDPRYDSRAYEFVLEALKHTLDRLGQLPTAEEAADPEAHIHISPRQWLEGICDLASRDFGLMARSVFRLWGIERTGDFGEIIFNLVDANLITTSEADSRSDFRDVLDLDEVLIRNYRIPIEETE